MSCSRFTYFMLSMTAILIFAAAIIWLSFPWIDLTFERMLFQQETGFVFGKFWPTDLMRNIAIIAYALWYSSIVASVIFANKNKHWPLSKYFGFSHIQWVYLAFTSLAGPLLVSNLILKDNWGRARPRQLEEFGGNLEFSPPLVISDQCQTNCSFVSGEPSSMFMIFISLAFIMPAKRWTLIAAAIVMGSLSGIMRMGQGGHFLSDVVFAGLFMAITAAAIYWLMFVSSWFKRIKNRNGDIGLSP